MRVPLPGAPKVYKPRPRPVGPGRLRKVGLLGSFAQSLPFVPWGDPTWEFWGHSSGVLIWPYECDALFDLHHKHVWQHERKNGFSNYREFLQRCRTPVYMQQQYAEVPASVAFPYETLRALWPDVPIASQVGHMVALALYQGVTHLGFWGIEFSLNGEYDKEQRANAERWVGIAEGLGVQIVLPPAKYSRFCREPLAVYGYETHLTPEDYAEKRAAFLGSIRKKAGPIGGFDATRLTPLTHAADFAGVTAEKQPLWAQEMARLDADDAYPVWLQQAHGVDATGKPRCTPTPNSSTKAVSGAKSSTRRRSRTPVQTAGATRKQTPSRSRSAPRPTSRPSGAAAVPAKRRK